MKGTILVILVVVGVVSLECTFFRMTRAESSLADKEQVHFEEQQAIRVNHCDRSFWTATRHCDGIFLVDGKPTVSTIAYACDDERCKFECGN